MIDILVNTAASVLVGVGLWAVLPRGVMLSRSWPVHDWRGEIALDTWGLRNDSPLPVRILSVSYTSQPSLGTRWVELPAEGARGVDLNLDDETDETRRTDRRPMTPWREVVVQPGDTLRAHVPNNSALRIKYRRAGRLGLVERREITIHGFV